MNKYRQFFISRSKVKQSSEYLNELEKSINYTFQKNYRNFILEFENAYFDSEKYYVKFKDEIPTYGSSMRYIDILGLNEESYGFSNTIRSLEGQIPSSMLPIACVDLCNFVLFHKRFGEIFLYIHDEDSNNSGYPVFKIFDCLKDFLDNITRIEE